MVFLKNETTLFKHIILRDRLGLLGATSTGGEAIVVIVLHQGVLSWWVEDPQVPEFITRCEEAGIKAMRAGLDILYVWIVVVASLSLLIEKSFPDEQPKFKGLPLLNRTWEKWKTHL